MLLFQCKLPAGANVAQFLFHVQTGDPLFCPLESRSRARRTEGGKITGMGAPASHRLSAIIAELFQCVLADQLGHFVAAGRGRPDQGFIQQAGQLIEGTPVTWCNAA